MSRSLVNTDLPAGPPPEVMAEIDAAWERAQDLFANDFMLHVEVDADGGRVWGELFTPDGTLADTLSAGELLALACGDPRPALEYA